MRQLDRTEISKRFPFAYCSELSMFGALSADSVMFLLEHGRVMAYDKGEVLLKRGDCSDRFYIILQGRLGYYRYEHDEPFHIRDFHRGEQMGFVGMIGLHERRGDAVVEEESVLLEITDTLFHDVCDSFASDFVIFMINMTREMSREISDLDAICTRLSAQQLAHH